MKTWKRYIYLGLLCLGIGVILFPNFRHIRRAHQVKQTLLEIQTALQNYHVEKEFYPKKHPLSGAELIQILMESGHMKEPPFNPYTGKAYQPDRDENDRIIYSTSETFKTYSLKALHFDDEGTFLILDSTEHHALED